MEERWCDSLSSVFPRNGQGVANVAKGSNDGTPVGRISGPPVLVKARKKEPAERALKRGGGVLSFSTQALPASVPLLIISETRAMLPFCSPSAPTHSTPRNIYPLDFFKKKKKKFHDFFLLE